MNKTILLLIYLLGIIAGGVLVNAGTMFYEGFENSESITNNGGIITGQISFIDGNCSKYADMTSGSYITYPLAGNFRSYSSTIQFWVLADGRGFFDIGRLYGTHANSIGIFRAGSSVITEIRNNARSNLQAWSTSGFKYDRWNHITVTFGSLSGGCRPVTTYLNGNPGASKNVCDFDPSGYSDMWVGRTYYSSYGYSKPLIDEFKIFDYTKSHNEILVDYEAMKPCTKIILPPPECKMNKPQSKGKVQINCSGLYVNNKPFTAKGVGYQPIPIGKTAQSISDKQVMYNDVLIRERDFPLLRRMNANTIRVWSEVLNESWMDDLYNGGANPIYVIMGFWINCGEYYGSSSVIQKYKNAFREYVTKYKDHPAVLMWGIGNENNLGYCSHPSYIDNYNSLANELAKIAYEVEEENYHPVGIINGHLGGIGVPEMKGDDASMIYTDFWGVNIYNGDTFGDFFDEYAALTGKPLLITEYGTDALDDRTNQEQETVQANWNIGLWKEIEASNITLGSTIMAYSDEWWKGEMFGSCGSRTTHDFHCGHGDFPTPDGFSNEEWFGVVRTIATPAGEIDGMEPRAQYYAFQEEWAEEGTIKISLVKGWNLISIPLTLSDNSLANVFKSIEGNYDSVFSYIDRRYVKLNNNDIINPTMGVWVHMKNADDFILEGKKTFYEINLQPDWNLIGHPYLDEITISELYTNAAAYAYNNSEWQSYNPDRPTNTLTKFTPGYGYWIKNS